MRFEKVLLINPRYSQRIFARPILPAGIGYLSETLKNNNIDHDVIDMNLNYTRRDLKKKIGAIDPQLVGISLMSYKLNDNYGLVKAIKEDFPHIKIVVGGPHVSSIRKDIFNECPKVDFGVVQEGEYTLSELCSDMPLEQIKGLLHKKGGDVFFNGERPFIQELDLVPFPKFENFELERYEYGISIVSSRGCPYSCIYCSCNVIGKKIRFRSAGSVVSEIAYWHDKGYREFGFQEDNPTFDRQRMLEICDQLISSRLTDIKIMCGNGIRADRVDREMLIKMRQAGFKRLAIGVESGSDSVLKAIKKGTHLSTIESAIKETCDLGFFVSLFFIIGSPTETIKDVEKTIKLALKYPVQDVSFFNLVPMPGSELYSWVKEKGYFIRPPEEYLNTEPHPAKATSPIFYTPEFSAKERESALKKTQNVSRLIKVRTLQGRFSYLGIAGKIIFWVYTSVLIQNLENLMLRNKLFGGIINRARLSVRNTFYK